MSHKHISLAHGNGGRLMRELIDDIITPCLSDILLDTANDAVLLPLSQDAEQLMMTTDGFTVKPLEFPGGNIGSLAIHGTVNDLAVSGATPLYLSLNMFIEEGLAIDTLSRILRSLRQAAIDTNIKIVCGDTKVVPRGEGSELYLATTGIGLRKKSISLGFDHIQPGDAILISGPIGDHGVAVMFAREQFGLRGDLQSDAASVYPLAQALLTVPGLRFMRDPTRGGLAQALHEICHATDFSVRINMADIPVRDSVHFVCEMLGFDPLYMACEGRIVAVVENAAAQTTLALLRQHPNGTQAALIGHISDKAERHVILHTELGGERILDELEDDPLPRIC